MADHIVAIGNKVVEVKSQTSVAQVDISFTHTECKRLEFSAGRKKSLQARYAYGFIFLLTNLMAWLVRDYGQNVFPKVHYQESSGESEYSRSSGVLCVSLGCFIFFAFMFATTLKTRKLHQARNTWHSKWWTVKIVLLIISLAIPFFCPSQFIQYYGEVAHIGAGIFLLLQLMSVIQFVTWWNNYWMPSPKLNLTSTFGLFMSTIFYIVSVCGIVLMYLLYARKPSCTLNLFFVTWTAILFIVMMLTSLYSKVNKGLLSSGLMGLYIIFLCWSAIRSEPSNQKCSPASEDNAGKDDWTTVLELLIAICSIVASTFSTGINAHSFQKDEVQREDDIPYKYGFFHVVFSLGAMYFAMLFVSWQPDHSTKKWIIDVGWASTWVKIANEWLAASIYMWKLISSVDLEGVEPHASDLA